MNNGKTTRWGLSGWGSVTKTRRVLGSLLAAAIGFTTLAGAALPANAEPWTPDPQVLPIINDCEYVSGDDCHFWGDPDYQGPKTGNLIVSVKPSAMAKRSDVGSTKPPSTTDVGFTHPKAGDPVIVERIYYPSDPNKDKPVDFTTPEGYEYLLSIIEVRADDEDIWQSDPGRAFNLRDRKVQYLAVSTEDCLTGYSECLVTMFKDLPFGVYLVSGLGFEPFIAMVPMWDGEPDGMESWAWAWDQTVYPKRYAPPSCSVGEEIFDRYFHAGAWAEHCKTPQPPPPPITCDDKAAFIEKYGEERWKEECTGKKPEDVTCADGKAPYNKAKGNELAYDQDCAFPLIICPDGKGVSNPAECSVDAGYNWTLDKKVRPHCASGEKCQNWLDELSASNVAADAVLKVDYQIKLSASRSISASIPLTNPHMVVQYPAAMGTNIVAPNYLNLTAEKGGSPISGALVKSANSNGTNTWTFSPSVTIDAAKSPSSPGVINIKVTDAAGAKVPDSGKAEIVVTVGGSKQTFTVNLAPASRYDHLWDIYPELAAAYKSKAKVEACTVSGKSHADCIANDAEKVIASPNQDGVSVFTYSVDLGSSHFHSGVAKNIAHLSGPVATSEAVVRANFPGSTTTAAAAAVQRVTGAMTRTGVQIAGGGIGLALLGLGAYLVTKNRRKDRED